MWPGCSPAPSRSRWSAPTMAEPGPAPEPTPAASSVAGAGSPGLGEFATLDLDRAARRGYPEAVYCQGKTVEQVAAIAASTAERPEVVTLFTRADPDQARAVLRHLPQAHYDRAARLLAWPPEPPQPSGGLVVVLAA